MRTKHNAACLCLCLVADEVVAVYAYQAQRDDELSFAINDVITVIDRFDSDWWRGQLHSQIGMFPSNYVAAPAEHDHVNSQLAVTSAAQRMHLAIVSYVNTLRMCEIQLEVDDFVLLSAAAIPLVNCVSHKKCCRLLLLL